MVNEAATCFEENIISRPEDGDIGAVFGLGFPPIYGGPFRYLDSLGAKKFADEMKSFEDQFGGRFTPANIILEKMQSQKSFYTA